MTQSTNTVLDRYFALNDRVVKDSSAIVEFETIFAPDAIVIFSHKTLVGIGEITDFYRQFVTQVEGGLHHWSTRMIGDGIFESHWLATRRLKSGSLFTTKGIKIACVNSDGLIIRLRVEEHGPPSVTPPQLAK